MQLLVNKVFHYRWLLAFLFSCLFIPFQAYAAQAIFTATPTSGPAPLRIELDATASIPSAGATITSYQWKSSDGQFMLPINIQQIQFTKSGNKTITLTVTDSLGTSSSSSQVIRVSGTSTTPVSNPSQPIANFNISPLQGIAPLPITLDASPSWSSNGSIVGYQWSITPSLPTGSIPTVINPSIILDEQGSYIITLTVRDNLNQTATTSRNIFVSPGTGPAITTPFLTENEGTSLYAGVMTNGQFLENGAAFSSNTPVEVTATIETATAHIGRRADILVAIEYTPVGSLTSQWYFKTESSAFTFVYWDFVSPMTSVEPAVTLNTSKDISIFSGHFKNLFGTFNVYFGYFLLDGSGMIVSNLEAPLTFQVIP